MDPRDYLPRYLEHEYLRAHEGLTPAARELLREEIVRNPDAYATTEHARAWLSYARVHEHLSRELYRMEALPDEEFERQRERLFRETRLSLKRIGEHDRLCVDARLVDILLADVPLDACLGDLMRLEREVREHLEATAEGFDLDALHFWSGRTVEAAERAERTVCDPVVVGWLHINEALGQLCLASARYRAAAEYARLVLRADGYRNGTEGMLLLALARLEDEDGFFEAVRTYGEHAEEPLEESPWFLLGRTLLLFKLGRRKSAKRALKDFAARCDGGAFFLLNPTYLTPYLPVRPANVEPWERSHQAVWEADGIIVDTPDFVTWASKVEGIEEASERFARRQGY